MAPRTQAAVVGTNVSTAVADAQARNRIADARPTVKTEGAAITPKTPVAGPLSVDLLLKMNAYWRAANYLSVGQIYLKDNPLLEEPLRLEHIKPRLLGHWGTTPGLNFLYVHLNRLIKDNDLNMIYVIGPGHGGPGIVAQTYLEGSYTERYPAVERDRSGLHRLFRQFSWPYGIPSHVAPETPGSIHEGGELGYSLVHAYGAAFDNPGFDRCLRHRRRRGRNWCSRHQLAFQQVLEPGARWRGASDPSFERIQDC